MDFLASLKATAQQIIELTEQLGERAHTWNQEKSAPSDGYTDRAGFVVFDDLELFADVYESEDGAESVLRARLAWAPKHETDQDTFTIITLDFSAVQQKVRDVISQSDNVTAQSLISLLQDSGTVPKLIHVSLESSIDSSGNNSGKRYEYQAEDMVSLSEADKAECIATLSEAFELLSAKAQG